MRYFWIGIVVLLSISSCAKEDDLPFELSAKGLVGTWELYQYQGNTGGGDYRTAYEPSGKTITFLSNGELRSVAFFGCSEGEYQVKDLLVTIIFHSEEEVPEQSFSMRKDDDDLVLAPQAPYMCIEGCSHIFKKID